MSVYHKDKCTKEQALKFKVTVKNYLDKNKLPYQKLMALTSYDGEVRIYTGKMVDRIPQKRSRKLVAWKNTEGKWKGDLKAVEALKGKAYKGNTKIYEIGYHSTEEVQHFPVYRSDWGEDEKWELKKWIEDQKKEDNF